jgi:FAD:protein FMN transferase
VAGVRGLVLLLTLLSALSSPSATLNDKRSAMGSRFEITAVHPDEKACQAAIDAAYAEIERIEEILSEWRESSPVSEINRKAGIEPVVAPKELINLVRRSVKVSQLTDGAFDITFHTVGRLWNFKSKTSPIPDAEAIRAALDDIGYRHIIIDDARSTVFIDRPGTRIGFGAIGKGYAANRAVFVLREHGVSGGVVNAGGDLVVFGAQENGKPWRIGIANPLDRDEVFAWLDASDQAVVTSGDYENHTMPVLWDETHRIAEHYRPPGMPATFVLDLEGKIVYRHVGSATKDWDEMVAFLDTATGRK